METGFHDITKEELCREWHTMMKTNTIEGICSSVRFLRVCQEIDCRKITPFELGKILADTNNN